MKLVFIDGVDGSGKTTLTESLCQRAKQLGLKRLIINKYYPPEVKPLFDTDRRYEFNSTPGGKLAYRVARTHFYIETAIKSKVDIAIFDRGLLHFMVRSTFNKVDTPIIQYFYNDLSLRLQQFDCYNLFLNPPFEVIQSRLAQRETLNEKERDANYLREYIRLCEQFFAADCMPGTKIKIDTSLTSTSANVERVFNSMICLEAKGI